MADEATGRASELRKMLEAVVERRKARAAAATERVPLTIYCAGDIKWPLPPLWRSRMENAEKDGVMESLYASIREEGWRACAIGGLYAMRALADRACGDSERLSGILDHRWDGIGTSEKGVWCC
jgi:hypothetical protein